ncbi:hypothetical protein LINPERPRIM_LOCUS15138 [Linum perenne]
MKEETVIAHHFRRRTNWIAFRKGRTACGTLKRRSHRRRSRRRRAVPTALIRRGGSCSET